MLVYPAWVLAELKRIAERSETLFIADEVMTGWGGTGTMFACEQAGILRCLPNFPAKSAVFIGTATQC